MPCARLPFVTGIEMSSHIFRNQRAFASLRRHVEATLVRGRDEVKGRG